MDRAEAIKKIKAGLEKRSGKKWSVTGGRGTGWGWLRISAPPARCSKFGQISEADSAELKQLLGFEADRPSSFSVAASNDHYQEYIDRAEGRSPSKIAEAYWD